MKSSTTTTRTAGLPAVCSTGLLGAWLAAREHNQAIKPTAREQLETAVARVEATAYTRGLQDGLLRLEMLSLLMPSRQLTGPVLIEMAGKELAAAVRKWQLKYAPNAAGEPPAPERKRETQTP